MKKQELAGLLGWFSIGLGVAEVLAPRRVAKVIGVEQNPGLLRLMGFREIAAGVGILTQPKPRPWLWSRVAGDALDLAFLGASKKFNARRTLLAGAAVAGVTVLDVLSSKQHDRDQRNPNENGYIHQPPKNRMEKSVIINRSREELYEFWRDFENLPRFMNHLKSVQITGPNRSHWVARGPGNTEVEWEAEIIEEKANELIAWRSLEGSAVDTAGSVRFEPATGGRGTIIRIKLQYHPPGGILGKAVAKIVGESPEKQIAVDLRRLKQFMETGEIARTEGQSAGRPSSTSKKFDDFVRL